jgi:hypothetical protein
MGLRIACCFKGIQIPSTSTLRLTRCRFGLIFELQTRKHAMNIGRSIILPTLLLASSATFSIAEMAKGKEILAAVSGNTIEGKLDSSGAYTEYCTAAGIVYGKDYKAKWSIEDDVLCWTYQGPHCWRAEITGDQIKLFKYDVMVGAGIIVRGNPNGFR